MFFSLSTSRLAALLATAAGLAVFPAQAQHAPQARASKSLVASSHSAAPTPTTKSTAPEPELALVHPEFPGGDAALIQFLGQNLTYPKDAWDAGAEGKVVVSFWIDERGQPYGFGVLQSLYPSLDAEAMRALKLMPTWTSGRRDGKPAPMVVHVPVVFRKPASTN